jgi:hypothetical protein
MQKNNYDISNKDQDTFYIVLRNDLNKTIGEQLAYATEIGANLNKDGDIWNTSACNYVILQASAEDLFKKNIIPNEYDDTRFIHIKLIKAERQIGKGNFVCGQPELVGLGYFGKKKYMPKFLKKLNLFVI